VDGYHDGDRERARELSERLEAMSTEIAGLKRGQRVSLRRIRRIPDLTATALVRAVGKRALFLIGVGIAIAAGISGLGIAAVRDLAIKLMGAN
jgi:hypothetical protein